MSTSTSLAPVTTPFDYIGDIPALGSLQLTKLARSFEEIETTNLEPFFPAETIDARTIVIETIKEGLGIMPIVKFGQPAGSFAENDRIEQRIVQPAVVREDDFLDQGMINQLRAPGTMNDNYGPEQLVSRRVQKLVNRHNRTLDFFRAQALLGGISYRDPRTNVSINVSTNIPAHNMFRYDGFNGPVAAGSNIPGTPYVASRNLTNNKGRTEALLFTDGSQNAGIPWSDPQADIIRCLRYLKQYLMNTNKNRFTDLVMSRDLYTVIQENNFIKAYMGGIGVLVGSPGTSPSPIVGGPQTPAFVAFGPGGDVTQLAGMNIVLVDNLFRDPTDDVIKKMWPSHRIAMVARSHMLDASATLGRTQFCVGEAPDAKPGMWMRTGPDQMPPSPPGRTMQMGNSFLPYAIYPHWIALIDVCEPQDVDSNLILRSDLSYGTF